ncbi:putative xenobiotic-transporting ATPase [Medicago truncatula]|uniref:Putative xenobiotic-transporting ATPase n=1 Tax=Medicago truncatula TaxID=3880 RepID=A0A396HMJ1_MEDTR|nr:putative xenobiotic-transporting ATPase [Medicago truncatula]
MADNTEVHENSSSSTQQHVNKANQIVPFYKLFSFADRLDVTLMIIGTISAMANGFASPLMTLLLGKVINAFGSSNQSEVLNQVSKVFINILHHFCFVFFLVQINMHVYSWNFCKLIIYQESEAKLMEL